MHCMRKRNSSPEQILLFKKCMGLGKQGYKTCPVCGEKLPESVKSTKICCSPECSKKYRSGKHKEGKYDDSMVKMRQGFANKVNVMDLEEGEINEIKESNTD